MAIKVRNFRDPAKFLDAIGRRSRYLPSQSAASCSWIFRGQAIANWSLNPTSLREEGNLLDSLHRSGRDNHWHQICFEVEVLKHFVEHADQGGLTIPEDGNEFREWLDGFGTKAHQERLRGGEEVWPHWEYLSLIAVAQHYGLPTRLLDWTRNPLTAAYFAATSAARLVERSRNGLFAFAEEQHLAIWALSIEWMNFAKAAAPYLNRKSHTQIVTAPYSSCPNLGAQDGLFTCRFLHADDFSAGTPEVPFDLEVSDLSKALSSSEHAEVIALGDAFRPPTQPLLKFTFPISDAYLLLRELRREGVSAAKLFPGFSGAAMAVLESVYLSLALSDL